MKHLLLKNITTVIAAAVFGLSVAFVASYAQTVSWSAPVGGAPPPENNLYGLLNTLPLDQTKAGGLALNAGLIVNFASLFNGPTNISAPPGNNALTVYGKVQLQDGYHGGGRKALVSTDYNGTGRWISLDCLVGPPQQYLYGITATGPLCAPAGSTPPPPPPSGTIAGTCAVSSASGQTGQPVTFTATVTSSGASGVTYTWNGTDVTTAVTGNPFIKTYLTAGTKTMQVALGGVVNGVNLSVTVSCPTVSITVPPALAMREFPSPYWTPSTGGTPMPHQVVTQQTNNGGVISRTYMTLPQHQAAYSNVVPASIGALSSSARNGRLSIPVNVTSGTLTPSMTFKLQYGRLTEFGSISGPTTSEPHQPVCSNVPSAGWTDVGIGGVTYTATPLSAVTSNVATGGTFTFNYDMRVASNAFNLPGASSYDYLCFRLMRNDGVYSPSTSFTGYYPVLFWR